MEDNAALPRGEAQGWVTVLTDVSYSDEDDDASLQDDGGDDNDRLGVGAK